MVEVILGALAGTIIVLAFYFAGVHWANKYRGEE